MSPNPANLKVNNISMTLSLALNLTSISAAGNDDFQSLCTLQFKYCSTDF